MDIISMQIANKVLKRMNTEFNGLYDIFIATGGQKVFRSSKPHDITNKGLHVYVNGFHAVEEQDYVHKDQYDIEFKQGLNRGDIVLLSTQVVGVPKFEVINPAYDDGAIKAEIVQINNRIQTIINALDDNGDGSIIDTIANLKKLWEDADGDLVKLIELAATKEELAALSTRVDNIPVTEAYDDTVIKGQIVALEKRVKAIEDAPVSTDLYIHDDKTGRKHKIALANGVLSAAPVGVPMELSHTAPQQAIINAPTEFRFNVIANADLGQKVKLAVAHNDKLTIESNSGSAWEPFVTSTIESLTNMGYALRVTGLELGTHEVRFDILKFDNNVNLGSIVFSVEVLPVPSSKVSGLVELNGAATENILVSIIKDGDENALATGIDASGTFELTVTEAGTYTLAIENGTTTHNVTSETSFPVIVELNKNYAGYLFVLTEIAPPEPVLKTLSVQHNPPTVTVGAVVTQDDFNVVVTDSETSDPVQGTLTFGEMTDGADVVITDMADLTRVAGTASVDLLVQAEGYTDANTVLVVIVEETTPPEGAN